MATLASMTGLIRKAPLFEIYRDELRALGISAEVTFGGTFGSPSSAGVLREVSLKTGNQSATFGPKQIEFLRSKIGLSNGEICSL